MKAIALVGILLLVLGVLAFVVPVPHGENHSANIGNTSIGIHTEHSQKLPPTVGIVLLAGGVVALVVGAVPRH